MRDIFSDIDRWRAEGAAVAVATVIETWGSAPREVGAKMALTADGEIAGSVSGGCVEAAVFEAGTRVLETGTPQLLRFGVTDEKAWQVGLACGGTIEVFVEPLDETLHEVVRAAVAEERPLTVVTVVRGPAELLAKKIVLRDGRIYGSLNPDLDESVLEAAREALSGGRSRRVPLPLPEGRSKAVELFIDAIGPSPSLVVVGAVHIAIALTSIAKTLGYRTIVVDPRETFGSPSRFPHVDRLLSSWPDEALREVGLNSSTALAVLTHDPKLDDPALRIALPSSAFYVGALGSRATQARRRQRLLEAGLTEEELARLHAPIGLDLGGRSPEEIALSVMAQIVAERNRRTVRDMSLASSADVG